MQRPYDRPARQPYDEPAQGYYDMQQPYDRPAQGYYDKPAQQPYSSPTWRSAVSQSMHGADTRVQRREDIRDTLETLVLQTVPVERIIVVDDCSTDRTAEFSSEYPVEVIRTPECWQQGQGAKLCASSVRN